MTEVNTNMHFESFHRLLKYSFLGRCGNIRLDSLIQVLFNLLKDRLENFLWQSRGTHFEAAASYQSLTSTELHVGCSSMQLIIFEPLRRRNFYYLSEVSLTSSAALSIDVAAWSHAKTAEAVSTCLHVVVVLRDTRNGFAYTSTYCVCLSNCDFHHCSPCISYFTVSSPKWGSSK